jgi:hypothetical protein
VTSIKRASGSADGSVAEGSAEGVAAGVRPGPRSEGETPAWGVDSGVFVLPPIAVLGPVMVGVNLYGGSASIAVSNVTNTLICVGHEIRKTQVSNSSLSKTPALAMQTRQLTRLDCKISIVVCQISFATSRNMRVPK